MKVADHSRQQLNSDSPKSRRNFFMDNQELPKQRAIAALKSLFIGDALAMPVHWYYSVMDIERQFPGGVTDFEDAPAHHPSSIMSLHSTSQGGRGNSRRKVSAASEIVGDVILKGKRKYWGVSNQHYHQQMVAGENTLNAHCAMALMKTLNRHGGQYSPDRFLGAYINLMTADPAQHPDTYAESYHRGYFANLQAGKPRDQCGAVTHDTASIGGLVTIAPIVIAARLRGVSLEHVSQQCHDHILLTHPDETLVAVTRGYVELIDHLLFRDPAQDVKEILSVFAKQSIGLDLKKLIGVSNNDRSVIGQIFSPACYISDSWPGVLYLTYKYADSLLEGLIANTNLGGDNVHRGAVLGVLLGLINGATDEDKFGRIANSSALQEDIAQLIDV